MTTLEQERAAYMAGDTQAADLLARIDDLTADLALAEAENETLRGENDTLAAKNDGLQHGLNRAAIEYVAVENQRDKLRNELTTLNEKIAELRQRVEAVLKC